MTLDEIILRVSSRGAAQTAAQVGQVNSAVKQLGGTATAATGATKKQADGLTGISNASAIAAAGVAALAGSLGVVSGVSLAAKFERIEAGLRSLLGSAPQARKMIQDFKELGASAPDFDTLHIADFGRKMLSAGFAAKSLTKDLKTVLAAGSVSGATTGDMDRAIGALGRIRRQPKLQADEASEFTEAIGLNLARIVSAATGRTMNEMQARNYLQAGTGQRASDILLKGMDTLFKGKFSTTVIGTWANLMDTLAQIMVPTGERILQVLGPLLQGVAFVADLVKNLNETTFGFAGLAVIAKLVHKFFWAGVGALVRFNQRLDAASASLAALAATGRAAVLGMGGNTTIIPAGGGAAAAAGGVGLRGAIAAMAARALGFLKGPAAKIGIGLGVSAGADWLGDKVGGYYGRLLKNIGTWGALGGMTFGMPGVAGGAALGAGVTIWEEMNRKEDEQTAELKKQSQILSDIRGVSVGLGARGTAAQSRAAVEIAVARAQLFGIG